MQIEITKETEKGDVIKTLELLTIQWRGKTVTVPKGFTSDGVSVPQFLWSTVSPPIDPRSLRAGIVHDYLYRECPKGWTRKKADDLFYDLLREDGLSWWKSQKAYWGVRLFGGSSWNNNNNK